MSYIRPLIPVAKVITTDNLFDNFDERTIINDDLNMTGFKIYNLKDHVDDYDAVTKLYVDTKVYKINSANIVGNLPWNRLINIPASFPSKTSSLLVDSNIDIGNYKFMKNGNEVIGLTNNSVNTNYIANNAVTNNKIVSLDYSKLFNVPITFPAKTSSLLVDSNFDIGNFKFMKNGNELNFLTTSSIITDYIADNTVTNNMIASFDYSKLTNIPSLFPTKTSMITIDSN